MAFQPNLGGVARAGYVVFGAGLMAWGFLGAETPWMQIALPIVGAVVIVEGLIGY